jgi:hypothetical protein
MTLQEDLEKVFKDGQIPKLETDFDRWKVIETLGGVSWNMRHDASHGRITLSDIDIEFIATIRRIHEGFVEILKTKYNIIPPQECIPLAPVGKTYYWDWYDSMKKTWLKEEYNKIICSACALHEQDGVEKMSYCIPCSVYPGSIYRLDSPWECAMITGRFPDWTEKKLFTEMKEKGGEDSVKRYKQKLTLLRAVIKNDQ